jgi:hypothetical protein
MAMKKIKVDLTAAHVTVHQIGIVKDTKGEILTNSYCSKN